MDTTTQTLSPQELDLAKKCGEAIQAGIQLQRWCRDPKRRITESLLDLKAVYTLPNQAFGYFADVEINNIRETVMGVRQVIDFSSVAGPNPEQQLRDFVLGEFTTRAHWVYPDGNKGGMTAVQSLYRDARGQYGRYPPDLQQGCIDWRLLGKEYEWSMFTLYIHDFVMKFGPMLKRFNEAACVVAHADFVHVVENPSPGVKLEVSIGYPFVAFAPIPNVFGFGPGKFGTAVNLFSFYLTDKNEVKVTMDFAAAPRCAKVFDFGRSVPDPVYGRAAVLQALSLGLWNSQKFHDKLDTGMLEQHARVHQALMEGTAKIWNEYARKA